MSQKRLAGFELVPQRPVERERFVRAPQPLLRQRVFDRGSRHACGGAALRAGAVVVIREGVNARSGCREQVACFQHLNIAIRQSPITDSLADRAWASNQHVRHCLFCEGAKHLEVASIGSGIVAGRRAAHRGEGRLVHKLGRSYLAADRPSVIQKSFCLFGCPHAGVIARSHTRREGRDDPCIDCPGEIDDALPLVAF